jgi:hypothetical protein
MDTGKPHGDRLDADDDIASSGGSDIPLHSDYPAMVEIRDTSGDQERQQAIADQIFAALKAAARWPVVYIDDIGIVCTYPPQNGG